MTDCDLSEVEPGQLVQLAGRLDVHAAADPWKQFEP